MSATGFSLQVSAKGLVKENLSVSRLASQSTVCCLGKWSWKLSENFPQLWVTNSEPDFWWIIFVYFDYKILVSVSLLDMWKQTPPPKTRSHIHERPILVTKILVLFWTSAFCHKTATLCDVTIVYISMCWCGLMDQLLWNFLDIWTSVVIVDGSVWDTVIEIRETVRRWLLHQSSCQQASSITLVLGDRCLAECLCRSLLLAVRQLCVQVCTLWCKFLMLFL